MASNHGLVDMSSSLELHDAVCVCGRGLCVFKHGPAFHGHRPLTDLTCLFRRPSGRPRDDGHMLVHYLTTTAPGSRKGEHGGGGGL